MMFKHIVVLSLFLFFLTLGSVQARPKGAAYFVYGQSQVLLQEQVGEVGGVFILPSNGFWYDGAQIEVPEGTLEKDVSLTVSYNDGFLENVIKGRPLDGALLLEIKGVSELSRFVSLKIPQNSVGQERVCMGYVPDESGTLQAMTSIRKDEIITFSGKTAIALICS